MGGQGILSAGFWQLLCLMAVEVAMGGQEQLQVTPFMLQLSCRQGAPGCSALQWQAFPLWYRSRKSGFFSV